MATVSAAARQHSELGEHDQLVDMNQDPRPPSRAYHIDRPAVAGPTMIGDFDVSASRSSGL
jgi:hypothetical protein